MQGLTTLLQASGWCLAILSTWYVGGKPVEAGAMAVASPTQQPSLPAMATPKGNVIHRAPDGFFYVTARINGTPVRLLVDTAASMLVLHARDASRAGLVATPQDGGQLTGIGGGTGYDVAHVARLRLAGRDIHHVQAAVTSSGAGISLVGQNVLAQFSGLEIRGDELRFH